MQTEAFAGKRILVTGEAILDRYLTGEAQRISREAPVPVLSSSHSFARCGGAANVAANIVALGSHATLVALRGDDVDGKQLEDECAQAGIEAKLQPTKDLTTAVKTRVLAEGQHLLRIDNCQDQSPHAEQLKDTVLSQLEGHDALVISDYGMGALSACAAIIAAARKRGMPIIVDPRAQDWSKYRGASMLTPNIAELEQACGGKEPTAAAATLRQECELEAILVTAGASGMTLYADEAPAGKHYPTRTVDVYDVTGAGDTVVAVISLGLAAKLDLDTTIDCANQAAGRVVGKLGAATVTPEDFSVMPAGHNALIVDLDTLCATLQQLRTENKKVVMTNGCFDIFHAGHLESLGQAAYLGDVLVVAINDDASITKIKGSERPIVTLDERIQVIAGLGCVDYVVPFSDTDACGLVQAIKPDIYVKGDDWKGKEMPEAKLVDEYGGKIVYQPSRPHISTTDIIKRIKEKSK